MTTVAPPTERRCERCGRRDVWDADRQAWTIAIDDEGNRETGKPHCLHEWDINGAFNPFQGTS
jgi:hypothetical protein